MQTKSMSKHTNHSTNEPDNLHVNQFTSELVHGHITQYGSTVYIGMAMGGSAL